MKKALCILMVLLMLVSAIPAFAANADADKNATDSEETSVSGGDSVKEGTDFSVIEGITVASESGVATVSLLVFYEQNDCTTIDISKDGDLTVGIDSRNWIDRFGERSYLGAIQNRLVYGINHAASTAENLSLAEKRILDDENSNSQSAIYNDGSTEIASDTQDPNVETANSETTSDNSEMENRYDDVNSENFFDTIIDADTTNAALITISNVDPDNISDPSQSFKITNASASADTGSGSSNESLVFGNMRISTTGITSIQVDDIDLSAFDVAGCAHSKKNTELLINMPEMPDGTNLGVSDFDGISSSNAVQMDNSFVLELGSESGISFTYFSDIEDVNNVFLDERDITLPAQQIAGRSVQEIFEEVSGASFYPYRSAMGISVRSGTANVNMSTGTTIELNYEQKDLLITNTSDKNPEDTDHNWVKTGEEAATCVLGGKIHEKCTIHNETRIRELKRDLNAHSMDVGAVTTPATCVSTGVMTYRCMNTGCDYAETRDIPVDPNAHKMDMSSVTFATCASKGKTESYCAYCSHTTVTETDIDPNRHIMDKGTVTIPATCASIGIMTYTCANGCRYSETATIPIDRNAHKLDGGEVITPATCMSTGVITYRCVNADCDYVMTKDISVDPNAHSMDGGAVTTPATCISTGVMTHRCVNSGCTYAEIKDISVDPNAHEMSASTITLETCTSKGKIETRCKLCAYLAVEEIDIDPNAHTLDGGEVITPATCMSTGVMSYRCVNAGCTYTETKDIPFDPNTHSMDGGAVTTSATCASTGVMTYRCVNAVCDYTETKEIAVDPNAHVMSVTKITLGTCSIKGKTETRCKYCAYQEVVETDVDPNAHMLDGGTVATAATCISTGVMTYRCTNPVCDYSITKDIPVDPNAHEIELTRVTPPTCVNNGATEGYCKMCKRTITVDIPVDPNAHILDGGTVTMAATCMSTGVITYRCINMGCDYTETKDIPVDPNAHDIELTRVTPSTCVNIGAIEEYCIICNRTMTAEIPIDLNAHAWDGGMITTPATCVSNGAIMYTCMNVDCGATYMGEVYSEGTEHTYENGVCIHCKRPQS